MTQPPVPQRPPGSYPPPQGHPPVSPYSGPPQAGPYGPPQGGPYGPQPGGSYGPQQGGPYGPPQGPPPGSPYGPPAGPPKKKSSAGKIVAIVLVVLLVILGTIGYFVYRAVSGVVDSVGGLAQGASATCAAVSTEDVNATLGGQWTVFQLGGLSSIAGPVLDSRVLPDAPTSCWATQENDGKLARIARYQGADAAARFATEKQRAQGSSVDKGNGISVTTDGYLGKVVQAGDEAFCTTGDPLSSAGALVRRGDTLVYVSTTAAGGGAAAVPDIDVDPSSSGQISFGTDAANCALAVKLIERVH